MFDVWIVTSRSVAAAFLRANPEWQPVVQRIPRVVAIGPGTAQALRDAGVPHVRTAPGPGGAASVLANLPAGGIKGRTVLYLRSELASPELARELRRRGARVLDRIAYRVRLGRPLAREQAERLASLPIWVVTSPSALSGFIRMIGIARFRARRRSVRAFALGPRTLDALRARGLVHAEASSDSHEEGFTKFLEQALDDA
jgi:uroporphyrinogen-III synthase